MINYIFLPRSNSLSPIRFAEPIAVTFPDLLHHRKPEFQIAVLVARQFFFFTLFDHSKFISLKSLIQLRIVELKLKG